MGKMQYTVSPTIKIIIIIYFCLVILHFSSCINEYQIHSDYNMSDQYLSLYYIGNKSIVEWHIHYLIFSFAQLCHILTSVVYISYST